MTLSSGKKRQTLLEPRMDLALGCQEIEKALTRTMVTIKIINRKVQQLDLIRTWTRIWMLVKRRMNLKRIAWKIL